MSFCWKLGWSEGRLVSQSFGCSVGPSLFLIRAGSHTSMVLTEHFFSYLSIEMSVLFKDDLRVVDNLNLPTDEPQFVKGTIAIQNFVKRASFPNELEIQRRKIEK